MSTKTTTETPWQVHGDHNIIGGIDGPDDGKMNFSYVCDCEETADAELIVKAVNERKELIEALQWLAGAVRAQMYFGLPEEVNRALLHADAMIERAKR